MLIQSAMSVGGVFAGTLLSSVVAVADHLPRPSSVQCRDLFERLRMVGDGRSDVGRSHPVAAVLTLAAAAVVGGMRSYAAIAGWVADAPRGPVGADVYARCGLVAATPSKCTIWRVVTGADAGAVDAAVGAWLAERAGFDIEVELESAAGGRTRRCRDTTGDPRRRRQTGPRRHRRRRQRPAPAGRGHPRRTAWSSRRSTCITRRMRSRCSRRCWTPSTSPGC